MPENEDGLFIEENGLDLMSRTGAQSHKVFQKNFKERATNPFDGTGHRKLI